jgi:hypothetical protein
MSEQRMRVESGPPPQMISDGDAGATPATHEEPGTAQQVKDEAQQAAAPVKERAREVAGEAKSHMQAAAGQAKNQAAAQVDEKSTQVGQQIGSQGAALEGVAGELRKQGKDGPANIAEQAADKVKNVGDYLEQADGEKLVETAQKVAQDNPAAAAAVGAVAGFAAGRVIKASLGDDGPSGDSEPAAPDAAVAEPGQGTGAP